MKKKEMEVYKTMYLEIQEIEYLIVIGDYIAELVCRLEKNRIMNSVSIEMFVQYMEQLGRKSLEEIAEELGLSNENAPLIVPYIIICKCMARGLGAKELWAPGVIVSDGIACDYAQKNRIYKPVYYLMGEESYYIDRISEYIAQTVLNENEKEFNQTIVYGADTDIATVINAAKRYPMMSKYQVVIVKEAQNIKNIEELVYYLQKPLDSTFLVLCHKHGTLD